MPRPGDDNRRVRGEADSAASREAEEPAGKTLRLDLRGLKCPLPALKTGKRLAALSSGERLEVVSDDPLAGIDIPHLCREGGHRLISNRRDGSDHRFLIERG